MEVPDVNQLSKEPVPAGFGLLAWVMITVGVAVVVLFIWMFRKEWREKHGPPYWARKRRRPKE